MNTNTNIPTSKALRKPVEIKWREGKTIHTVQAVLSTGGSWYQGKSTVFLTLVDGSEITLDESTLLKGHDKRCSMLYGRKWLQKIFDAETITLSWWESWENDIGGTPNDTENVWHIAIGKNIYDEDDHTWLIECTNRIFLHTMNNDEIEVPGEFRDALKKLFKGKKISIVTYEYIKHVEEL